VTIKLFKSGYVTPIFNIFMERQAFNGPCLVRYLNWPIFVNTLELKVWRKN